MLLFCSASLTADVQKQANYAGDYGFEQERMIIDNGEIFLVSSFDSKDYITVYNIYGTRLWEATFHAKILSWEVAGDFVIVFSKDRGGSKTYLTCIERNTGSMLWQRP